MTDVLFNSRRRELVALAAESVPFQVSSTAGSVAAIPQHLAFDRGTRFHICGVSNIPDEMPEQEIVDLRS